MRVHFLFLAILLPFVAQANPVDLLKIQKKGTRLDMNEIMLQAEISPLCEVADIDFMYYENVDPSTGQARVVRPMRKFAKWQFRKRLGGTAPWFNPLIPTQQGNSAACNGAASCHSRSLKVPEISWVNHGLKDTSLVIRAETNGSQCQARAMIDLNGRSVVVKRLKLTVDRVNEGILSASFRVLSLEVFLENLPSLVWRCDHDCEKTEGLN